MKRAPVARATARLAIASHRMFTPNGTRTSAADRADRRGHRGGDLRADPELVRDGRPRCRTGPRRRRPPGGPRGRAGRRPRPVAVPPRGSCCGRPGRPGKWSIAMTGLVVPKIRSSASMAPSSPARPGSPWSVGSCASCARSSFGPVTIVSMPSPVSASSSSRGRRRVGDQGADPVGVGDDRVGRAADLRPVGDDDQPLGPVDGRALDLGVGIVELGDPPARGHPGGTDTRGRTGSGRGSRPRPDPRTSARRGGPSRPARRRSTGRVPSRLAIGSEAVTATRPGRAGRNRANCSAVCRCRRRSPAHRRAAGVARMPISRFSRACWQGPGVEGDVERPGDVRGRAAVGLAHEPVALEQPDVAPDRHLRHAELAGRAHRRGWSAPRRPVRGSGAVGRPPRAGAREPSSRPASRHPHPGSPRLTTRIDEPCSFVFDYRGDRPGAVKRRRTVGRRGGSPWHRLARVPGAASSSSAAARVWSARRRRSTRRSSTRSSRRRSAPTLAFGVFWALSAFPRRGPRVGHDHLVRPQRPGPDHDGAARLEHAADRWRLRLGQPDPVAAARPDLATSAPRCRR